MKKLLFISLLAAGVFAACDKVDNAYPKQAVPTGLDWSLYPGGDSAAYVANNQWPTFTANTNTFRNVLIEDFTGHQCVNCPVSTANMESYAHANEGRVFPLAIHAGPSGLTGFQQTDSHFPTVFYNDASLELGKHFGQDDPGSAFAGNPAFCVNRTIANDQYVSTAGSPMQNKANACLSSALQVNLQAAHNYYPSTRGLFLHVEVDKIDQIASNLAVVVCLVEDSLIAPQTVPNTMDTDGTPGDPDLSHKDGRLETYVHRDILRGMIDNRTYGKTLTPSYFDANGIALLNYSYKLPAQYDPENMKLYIYVYNKDTQEIYHVIEKHFL